MPHTARVGIAVGDRATGDQAAVSGGTCSAGRSVPGHGETASPSTFARREFMVGHCADAARLDGNSRGEPVRRQVQLVYRFLGLRPRIRRKGRLADGGIGRRAPITGMRPISWPRASSSGSARAGSLL